ncbi:hypothetical protein [Cellulomonas sp. URHD0024]|nr:hypothetical protein [Cellulomonas sp. URHD0024]
MSTWVDTRTGWPGAFHVAGGTVIDDGGAPFRLTDVPVTED